MPDINKEFRFVKKELAK